MSVLAPERLRVVMPNTGKNVVARRVNYLENGNSPVIRRVRKRTG